MDYIVLGGVCVCESVDVPVAKAGQIVGGG